MKQCRMVALAGATVLAVQVVPSFAQSTAPVSAETLAAQQDQLQARYQVFVMEGVLERAVQHGGQLLSRRVQAVMPDMLLLAGAARARGFRLEGYGVFFDVEVPALRRSMAWSFRMLEQNGPGLASAVESLRRHVQTVGDPQARQDLEQALSRLELQVGPLTPRAGSATQSVTAESAGPGPSATVVSASAQAAPDSRPLPAERHRLLVDPGEAYTHEVKSAIIDAMLDHSGSIRIADGEWLTIAARDNEDRRLSPGDPYESRTIMLRIRGDDLTAFRTGQVSRDEARQTVEVREF